MRTPTSGLFTLPLVVALAATAMFATTSVTVTEGDTLSSIARRHGVSTAELVDWNDIDNPDRIFVGDVILLAAPAGSSGGTAAEHVVSAGDTLTLIAARYGASVAAIAEANGLSDADFIRVGQRLTIGADSVPDEVAPDSDAEAPAEHTVAPGETLFSIANRYQRTVTALAAANDIVDTDRIRAGDVLVIPPLDDTTDPEPEPAPPAPTPDEPAAADDGAEDTAAPDGGEPADGEETAEPSEESEPSDEPEMGEEPDSASADTATDEVTVLPDPDASAAALTDAFALWSVSYGVDQGLLEAIAWYATDWQPNTVGIDNRVGITQLLPAQVELVETRLLGRDLDPLDGPDGVRLAARYLRFVQDRTGTEIDALMAFRQGLDSLNDNGPTADAEAFALAVRNIRDQRS